MRTFSNHLTMPPKFRSNREETCHTINTKAVKRMVCNQSVQIIVLIPLCDYRANTKMIPVTVTRMVLPCIKYQALQD